MTLRFPKCPGCPLAGSDQPCKGQANPRACDYAIPGGPEHRPGFDPVLSLPSLPAAAASLVATVAGHVLAGQPKASETIKAARLAICATCDNHVDGRCRACRCSDSGLAIKAGWADASCPLNPPRWGPADPV